MIYGSVCSGIEAATVAWHPLGWRPAFFSEIEAFPRAVLTHHYPGVPAHGDFTSINEGDYESIELLVGGTPCQDFSVAGLRAGLAGDRGNLTFEFVRLLGRLRPRWVVWENVPGVLSIDGGRAFGAVLGGLAELGYGFAYRVLDAQHFGVPQRRRRVFVVGYLGDWRRPAAVLFEQESLRGDPAPRQAAEEGIANAITERPDRGGGNSEGQRLIAHALRGKHNLSHREDTDNLIAGPLTTNGGSAYGEKPDSCHYVTHNSLRAEGFDAGEDGTGRGTPIVAVTFDPTARQPEWSMNKPLKTDGPLAVQSGMTVRRLTVKECERLMGLPDNYTLVPYRGKPAADGPRYRALGNSMAVPCMRWIGERISKIERTMKGTLHG